MSKENPLFAGIQANDSKDLINFLLERFHQELNIIINNPNKGFSLLNTSLKELGLYDFLLFSLFHKFKITL